MSIATVLAALSAAVASAQERPNILVIWGDDIGWQNVSAYGLATMGYRTPNIDRLADEGIMFVDHYGQLRLKFQVQHPRPTGHRMLRWTDEASTSAARNVA
jgi:hypothetical protein